MKKSISLILAIFICFNFILPTCSLAYSAKEIAYQETKSASKTIKNLAVFIKFSDSKANVTNHIDDAECIENAKKIFNSEELFDMETVNGVIKVPSFKKYYEMQSYGKLSITTEIFSTYEDSHPIGYYLKYNETTNKIGYKNLEECTQREEELVNNAVQFVSNKIGTLGIKASDIDTDNNGEVDAISFFVEGQDNLPSNIAWGDLLWSHKSDNRGITADILGKQVSPYNLIYVSDYKQSVGVFSLNRGTYGTIIHEFGHTLGYMDLYRYDNHLNKPVGFYDIMGNTSYSNPGNFLTYFISEYNRETNWHSPLPVINKTTKNITLYKPEFQDENEKRAIKVEQYAGSEEYFIIEYHEKQNTYDTYCADMSGIVVYRVNEKNKYSGNTSGGDHGENDHIFVFRPNETALGKGDGDLTKATLNKERPILGKNVEIGNDKFDNETIYYSNGSNSGIVIEVTSETKKSVTFNVTFPSFDGEGTKDNPYLIYDVYTFLYFMERETENKYYKLMNDLDFAGIENYPKINFSGNLNGNNKTIENVSAVGTGIFNNIGNYNSRTVIENLNVQNIKVSPDIGDYLGGFASVAYNITLKNIHLTSGSVKNISNKYNNSLSSTGGFIGNVKNTTIIDNCSASIDVASEKNVGGFIGININATIKNSYANGKVSGSSNIGGFIGLQYITDAVYKVPENTYFDYSKTKISNAVGGYDKMDHNLTALPSNQLGKGIVGISVPQEVNMDKIKEINYNVTTFPSKSLPFSITSSDMAVAKYANGKIQALKNGTAKIYVDLKVGSQTMRMESKVNITNISTPNTGTGTETKPGAGTGTGNTSNTGTGSKPNTGNTEKIISEAEVLKYFGLTKKDGYIVGFKLGSSVESVKKLLSSYPNVKLSSFKDASGKEISSGIISTNMKFTLTFNGKQYNYIVVVKGDVNGDGLIYATDYVRIKNHIMGKKRLEGAYLKAADINNDNNIYATDYVRIKNYIMGKGKIEQN